jgi:AcrR family transcriptional regulator
MGTLERRERAKSELRTRIMDAARRLFADEGYEAVSMRRIAGAIEYSPTAIYDHFADKEALLREICLSDFAALAGTFQALAAVADPVERIGRIGRAYVSFAVKYPNHYRLMFMTARPARELGPEELSRRGRPGEDAYAFLHAAVTEAIARGRVRPGITGDAALLTQTLWAAVHGVASIEITRKDDKWIQLKPLAERTRLMIEATCGWLFTPPPNSTANESTHAKPTQRTRKAASR